MMNAREIDIDANDEEFDPESDACEGNIETLLSDLLEEFADSMPGWRIRTETFEEAGMLTTDRGIVLSIGKLEFQISIVRSR